MTDSEMGPEAQQRQHSYFAFELDKGVVSWGMLILLGMADGSHSSDNR